MSTAQSRRQATCRLACAAALCCAGLVALGAARAPQAGAAMGNRGQGVRSLADEAAGRPLTAVRLITGDLAVVRWTHRGSPSVTVLPTSSRSHIGFISYETASGSTTVIPDDALRAVGSGALDRRLFDISTLARLGDSTSRDATIRLAIRQRLGSTPVPLVGRELVGVVSAGAQTRVVTVRVAEFGALWKELRSRSSPTGLASGVMSIGLAQAGTGLRSYGASQRKSGPATPSTTRRNQVPLYNLMISAIDRNGSPYTLRFAELDSFRPEDQVIGRLQRFVTSGTLRLPAGKYVLNGLVETGTFGQPGYSQTFAMLAINLRSNQNAVLDARTAVSLNVSLDDPTAAPYVTYLGSEYQDGAYQLTSTVAWGGSGPVYATPMTSPGIGFYWHVTFLRSGWSYQAPSPVRYDVGQSYPNGVPNQLMFAFQRAQLARLGITYRAQGAAEFGSLVHWMGLSDGDQEHFQFGSYTPIPAHLTLFFSPNVPWIRWMWLTTPPSPPNGNYTPTYMLNLQRASTFAARSYSDVWDSLVIGPGVPATPGTAFTGCGSDWIGNIFGVGQPGFDANDSTMNKALVLVYRGKTRIGHYNLLRVPFYDICVVPKPGETIEVSAGRDDPGAPVSPAVDEKFKFSHLQRNYCALPLQYVRFSPLGLDDFGQAQAGGLTPIGIRVELQPCAPRTLVRSVRAQVSTDNGRTWHSVTVSPHGRGWSITVHDPAHPGYVSLRATVADTNGNTVTDTIMLAYRVAG